ncbi:MAG: hypothetical protein AAF688_02680, partial [Bacteroidota bacterium]
FISYIIANYSGYEYLCGLALIHSSKYQTENPRPEIFRDSEAGANKQLLIAILGIFSYLYLIFLVCM